MLVTLSFRPIIHRRETDGGDSTLNYISLSDNNINAIVLTDCHNHQCMLDKFMGAQISLEFLWLYGDWSVQWIYCLLVSHTNASSLATACLILITPIQSEAVVSRISLKAVVSHRSLMAIIMSARSFDDPSTIVEDQLKHLSFPSL